MNPQQAAVRFQDALRREDWRAAERALRQLLEVDRANPSLHHNLGLVLRRQGRDADAVSAFDTALRLAPAHPSAAFERAAALMDSGRLDEAEAGFRDHLARQPEDADALLNLGRLLYRRDAAEAAAEMFGRRLVLLPHDLEATIGKAEADQRLGRREGRATLRRLYRERPALRPRLLKIMTQGPTGAVPLDLSALL